MAPKKKAKIKRTPKKKIKKSVFNRKPKFNYEDIPFIPAYDLLEKLENTLKDNEIAAIAFALNALLPPLEEIQNHMSNWSAAARMESVSGRL